MNAHAERAAITASEEATRQEVEWQLCSDDLHAVRLWLDTHGVVDGLKIEPRPAQSIYDTYLDTDDGRVRRAGFALRLRDLPGHSEATLKELAPDSGGPRVRREINQFLGNSEEGAIAQGSGPVSTRVLAMAGTKPLQPLFRVRTERQRFAVLREDQETGEIALDDTLIASADGRSKQRLRRVEVEAMTDAPDVLSGLVERLRKECALTAATVTKYEAGLYSAGLSAPVATELGSTAIEPQMLLEDVALANLRRHVERWQACEPGARLGEDPVWLHDLRVAGRRLDASLRLFQSVMPASLLQIRPRLKALLRLLGTARDLDVQLSEFEEFAKGLDDEGRQRLLPLRERIESRRRSERRKMLRVLDRPATQRAKAEFQDDLAVTAGATAGSQGGVSAVCAPSLIREHYKKFRKAAKRIGEDSTAEEYHEVRRRAKRLRYAIDSFDGFYGQEAEDMLRALRRLQNRLGSHQDAEVAAQRLQAMATAPSQTLPAPAMFLLGIFFEQQRGTAAAMRQSFPKAYRKVTRRRWTKLLRAMDELVETQAGKRDAAQRHME